MPGKHLSGVEDKDTCLPGPGKTNESCATHEHIDTLHATGLLILVLPPASDPPIAILVGSDRHLPLCRTHLVIISLTDVRPQRSIQLVNYILNGDVCRAGRHNAKVPRKILRLDGEVGKWRVACRLR